MPETAAAFVGHDVLVTKNFSLSYGYVQTVRGHAYAAAGNEIVLIRFPVPDPKPICFLSHTTALVSECQIAPKEA